MAAKQAAARTQPLHHRHARQSLRRGRDNCRRSSRPSRNRGARRTGSSASSRSPSSSAIRRTRRRRKGAAAGSSTARGGTLHAPLDRWKPPADWGVGAHAQAPQESLRLFLALGDAEGLRRRPLRRDRRPDTDEEGIVCFITVAGFLNGPGFEKMRDDLRRTCSDIWVIDCSPEGHQPDVPTRIFQGVQQPVCIVLAARKLGKDDEDAGARAVSRAAEGQAREDKFTALAALSLDAKDWVECPADGARLSCRRPAGNGPSFAARRTVRLIDGSGVMPGRTWVIAPDKETLERRWERLIKEKDADKKGRAVSSARGRRRNFAPKASQSGPDRP